MNQIKRLRKKVFILVISLIAWPVLFSPKLSYAGASLTLNPSGSTWAIGTKGANQSVTSSTTWTVTGASNGSEDICANVADNLVTWTSGASAGNNTFVLKTNNASGTLIPTGSGNCSTAAAGNTITSALAKDGTYAFNLYFTTPTAGADSTHSLTVTLTATNWNFTCGSGLAVTHTAGVVSPVTVNITYGTVTSTLSGESKCWITRNLGATTQAGSATDGTDASAGWYWQFNRKQGYMVGTTPAWTIATINEDSDWIAGNDPCTIELGTGWRIPTYTEWFNADANGAWTTYTDTFASDLKLHAAGFLGEDYGTLGSRGVLGLYWSSTQQSSDIYGKYLLFSSSFSNMDYVSKAAGMSVRCLKD